ncbi:MAG: hypothetical protein GYB67_02875 [Chloroflexi bacterium]|nr:hypothetical protein [Chloroflexota bacterium]
MNPTTRFAGLLLAALLTLFTGACVAAAVPVVPTPRPTVTPTPTITPSPTLPPNVTLTIPPSPIPPSPTGGPSPTPLFGPTRTPLGIAVDATRPVNPNAPRIEFFTTDVAAATPGQPVNLYWSTRGTTNAVIYRLERGIRNQLWNVAPDGSLSIPTRRSDRGDLEFLLVVGDGTQRSEFELIIPLACPIVWFFVPPPEACPIAEAVETQIIEAPFERGRMIYIGFIDSIDASIGASYTPYANTVYSLFNDGADPAWVAIPNRYDPAIHPEFEPSFVPPPGFYQPVRRLGFVWRGNDIVRSRLGLGTQPEFNFSGFVQTAPTSDGGTALYISSADETVLQLLPAGAVWQIITPP